MCVCLCAKTVPNCRFTTLFLDAQNIINSDVKSAPLAHCDPSDWKHWTYIWKSRFCFISSFIHGFKSLSSFQKWFSSFLFMFVWVAHITVLTVTTSRRIFFLSYGMRLHPRRRGRSSEALAVCADGLLRAATSQAFVCWDGGPSRVRSGERSLVTVWGAGGCECRADHTACSQSHTRQEGGGGREGGQRRLNSRLGGKKKAALGRESQLYFGEVFSFERSFSVRVLTSVFTSDSGGWWCVSPLVCVCVCVYSCAAVGL